MTFQFFKIVNRTNPVYLNGMFSKNTGGGDYWSDGYYSRKYGK